MHRTTTRFWRYFEKLPVSVQEVARQNFQLLKTNRRHPSLLRDHKNLNSYHYFL